MSDDQTLEAFVRDEQEILWNDLGDAINSAVNGVWSMHAANVARRIVRAARLVGPTHYGAIPWSLTAGGVYEAVLRAGGLMFELPDDAEWERLDRLMSDHGARAEHRARFAATVAAIDDDREWVGAVAVS